MAAKFGTPTEKLIKFHYKRPKLTLLERRLLQRNEFKDFILDQPVVALYDNVDELIASYDEKRKQKEQNPPLPIVDEKTITSKEENDKSTEKIASPTQNHKNLLVLSNNKRQSSSSSSSLSSIKFCDIQMVPTTPTVEKPPTKQRKTSTRRRKRTPSAAEIVKPTPKTPTSAKSSASATKLPDLASRTKKEKEERVSKEFWGSTKSKNNDDNESSAASAIPGLGVSTTSAADSASPAAYLTKFKIKKVDPQTKPTPILSKRTPLLTNSMKTTTGYVSPLDKIIAETNRFNDASSSKNPVAEFNREQKEAAVKRRAIEEGRRKFENSVKLNDGIVNFTKEILDVLRNGNAVNNFFNSSSPPPPPPPPSPRNSGLLALPISRPKMPKTPPLPMTKPCLLETPSTSNTNKSSLLRTPLLPSLPTTNVSANSATSLGTNCHQTIFDTKTLLSMVNPKLLGCKKQPLLTTTANEEIKKSGGNLTINDAHAYLLAAGLDEEKQQEIFTLPDATTVEEQQQKIPSATSSFFDGTNAQLLQMVDEISTDESALQAVLKEIFHEMSRNGESTVVSSASSYVPNSSPISSTSTDVHSNVEQQSTTASNTEVVQLKCILTTLLNDSSSILHSDAERRSKAENLLPILEELEHLDEKNILFAQCDILSPIMMFIKEIIDSSDSLSSSPLNN